MGIQSNLIKGGFTNNGTADWGELATATPRQTNTAYCTSKACNGVKKTRMKKDVSTNKNNCPDCGHALLWVSK